MVVILQEKMILGIYIPAQIEIDYTLHRSLFVYKNLWKNLTRKNAFGLYIPTPNGNLSYFPMVIYQTSHIITNKNAVNN